jgi:hypothetical protein
VLAPKPIAVEAVCSAGVRCPTCAAIHPRHARPTFWSWIGRLFRARPPTQCPNTNAAKIVSSSYQTPPPGRFDCLIAVEAQSLGEAAFRSLAARADRCVFVGDGTPTSAFAALAERLSFEPWSRADERLICRLLPVPVDRRAELETEPIADRPEIELRILPEPDGVPQLAEVAFPTDFPIAAAKSYVFEQLGEAPLCNSVRGGVWTESPNEIVLTLGEPAGPTSIAVSLAAGVVELLEPAQNGWATSCLRFARAAEWTADTARGWVRQHCCRHDRSRTLWLDRASVPLA